MQIVTDRRGFLRRAGVAAVGAAAAPLVVRDLAHAAPDPSLVPFTRGVASGDPLPDGVIIWTRVDAPGADAVVPVEWVVARDVGLTAVVASGTVEAHPERDHAVKVDVRGLEPGAWYFYGFRALGARSLTGRTKTAPQGGVDVLRFGVVSCSNYQAGFFNSYAALAERQDLDAILHLGDYLYEGGASSSAATAFGEDRSHQPDHEILTLEDYRTRHGQYRTDPDLLRLHQLFPWVTTWDDHESTNDSWRDGAENHDPSEGDWFQRKAWAQQAYEEWLPIRVDDPSRIYRALRYGDLADIVVLDTRLDGRDQQVGTTAAVILEEAVRDPDRNLISPAQRAFWHDELSASAARGTTWRIVAQQVMMAPLNVGALPNLEELLGGADLPDTPLFLTAGPANALNPDQWDGYVAERDRFYDHLRANDIGDVVVLTGDIHTSWASDLTPDPLDPLVAPLGVEFVATSVTSSGFEGILGSAEAARAAEPLVQVANPHIKFTDLTRRGFVVLDVRPERVQAEFHLFESVAQRGTPEQLVATWQTVVGSNRLSEGSGPAPAGPQPPATPAAEVAAGSAGPGAAPTTTAVPTPATGAPAPVTGRLPATGGGGLLGGIGLAGAAGVAHLLRRRRPVGAAAEQGAAGDSAGSGAADVSDVSWPPVP